MDAGVIHNKYLITGENMSKMRNVFKFLAATISCTWLQPDFGIAAILASDPNLSDDYASGDVYTSFMERCVKCAVANISNSSANYLAAVKLGLDSFLNGADSEFNPPAGIAKKTLAFAEQLYAPVIGWRENELSRYHKSGYFGWDLERLIPSASSESTSDDNLSPVKAYRMEMEKVAREYVTKYVTTAEPSSETLVMDGHHGFTLYTPLESVIKVLPVAKSAMELAQKEVIGDDFMFHTDFQITTVYSQFDDKEGGWPVIWQHSSSL